MNPGADTPLPATCTETPDRIGAGSFHEERPALHPEMGDRRLLQRLAAVDLAEGIAHDVKNQLTVVVAALHMVSQRVGPAEAELLSRARGSAMRAAELMDELVRYAREPGGVEGGADVAAALETAVAGCWGYSGARGVRLEMRVADPLPAVTTAAPLLRLLLVHAIRWVTDWSPADARLVAEAAPAGNGIAIRLQASAPGGTPVALGSWPEALQHLANLCRARLGHGGDGAPTLYLAPGTVASWSLSADS